MATLKLQSNRPLYSNTVIGTLAVDGWAVTLIQRPPSPLLAVGPTKCNSPLINDQCANFILFDVVL